MKFEGPEATISGPPSPPAQTLCQGAASTKGPGQVPLSVVYWGR